ncbi:MAG: aminotransferase class III-fold pyridoxal phosphate-dependent enzyme [Chloroflexi bacterium]|nr:aminotransferase class III-fold pyridoxal phosphate-dependent enzyme [Chloroflexota bacterium]
MTILSRYAELHPTSQRFHERAVRVFPDGVTHDMRHNTPFSIYAARANGSRKTDVDGNELVDFVMGHGALLLGHGNPAIMHAVQEQLQLGTHYGASQELEVRWGEQVQRMVPSAQKLRFTSSGTEATMMALRLARAVTGREKIVRFVEHFHGWNDSVTGQPAPERTVPDSPGLPRGVLDQSIVLPQGDGTALERTLREDAGVIAAVILEPTGAHWGSDPIDLAFVQRLRDLTSELGIVLIFDEVITGFRVSAGGAQQAYGITPDLTTLAKIVAGGMPGGCVAGRAEIIDQIRFGGGRNRIAHPGTFNANPVSAAAGATCLELIADGQAQTAAADTAATLARAMNGVFSEESVAGAAYGLSSMLHIALGMEEQPPDGYSWGTVTLPSPPPRGSAAVDQAFRLAMLNEGVDLMSMGMMVSTAHTAADIDRSVSALRSTIRAMKEEALL